jgi:hypothetical protein
MRQTFDDYNETRELVDGSAAIHPHNLGILMLRSISSNGPFGHAKLGGINAFDTNYLPSADEVMANILHLACNMDEEVNAPGMSAPDTSTPPISAFVVFGRGSNNRHGQNSRGTRGGRSLPNKCNTCGSMNHILYSCAALLKWTLTKRKMIVKKYGTLAGFASAHTAMLSDVPYDDPSTMPTLEECTDEFDDHEVRVPSLVSRSHPPSLPVVTSLGGRFRMLDQLSRVLT